MLETPFAMLAILATWTIWAAVFVALGAAITGDANCPAATFSTDRTSTDQPRDHATQWLLWFWSGWCAVVLALQAWHFFLPVDERAAIAVAVAALVAALIRRRQLAAALSVRPPSRQLLVVAIALVVLWASLAMGEIKTTEAGPVGVIRITDTGLYHMPATRWNAAYPIVPGLGNLHGRLAYNNSSMLYAALVDFGVWSHRGHHIANGLLALAVLLPLFASVPRAFAAPTHSVRQENPAAFAEWIRHVARSLLIGPTMLYSYKHTTSLSPDLPAAMLGTVIAVLLIDLCGGISRRSGQAANNLSQTVGLVPRRPDMSSVLLVALLGATAVTVKLSMLATAGSAALVTLLLTRPQLKTWLLTATIFAVAIGAWSARGMILSGYAAYPSTSIALDVDWRVPRELAEDDRRWIVSWARNPESTPDEVLGGYGWVGPWIVRQLSDAYGVSLPLAIILASAGLQFARTRGNQNSAEPLPFALWPAALPFAAALAFMLLTAPDLSRFGGASVWILAILALTSILARLRWQGDSAFIHVARTAAILGIGIAAFAAIKSGRYMRFSGGLAPVPVGEMRTFRTNSGLELRVPKDGDRAWDAPLPNTPYPHPRLKLRDPANLGAGFAIERESSN